MKVDKHVSKRVFLFSIILLVLSVLLCTFAVFKEEYLIAFAMIVVMVLQVDNILTYRKQQNRKGINNNKKGSGRRQGK